MQYSGVLCVSVTFLASIIPSLCEYHNGVEYSKYFQNDPITEATSAPSIPSSHQIQSEFANFDTKITKYESLPPNALPYDISDLITPEIFIQENPLEFLIKKLNSERLNASWMIANLGNYLARKKIPPHYVPYVKAVQSLLRIQAELDNLDIRIEYIRNSWKSSQNGYFSLPNEYSTPEITPLFSPDVFSDPNPPYRILKEILNIPKNKKIGVIPKLMILEQDNRLPRQHSAYIRALISLLQKGYALEIVKTDIKELERIAALNMANSDQLSNKNDQENGEVDRPVS